MVKTRVMTPACLVVPHNGLETRSIPNKYYFKKLRSKRRLPNLTQCVDIVRDPKPINITPKGVNTNSETARRNLLWNKNKTFVRLYWKVCMHVFMLLSAVCLNDNDLGAQIIARSVRDVRSSGLLGFFAEEEQR